MIILATVTPAGGSGPVDALSMGLWLWLQFDSTDFSNAELQSSTSGSSNLDVPRMSSIRTIQMTCQWDRCPFRAGE